MIQTDPVITQLFVNLGVPGLLAAVLWAQLANCSNERKETASQFTQTLIKHAEVQADVAKAQAESNMRVATAITDLATSVKEMHHDLKSEIVANREAIHHEARLTELGKGG